MDRVLQTIRELEGICIGFISKGKNKASFGLTHATDNLPISYVADRGTVDLTQFFWPLN